jgi:hypothetical protein
MAAAILLDGGPLTEQRGDVWCCLLCRRQFVSERKLQKHLAKSELHRENLATATAAGRISQAAPAAKRADEGESDANAPRGKRERDEGSMSALEQMELFESRLKSQSKHRNPEKEKKSALQAEEELRKNGMPFDSNYARSMNNQMDWECGECGEFNFARVVYCHKCRHHVDDNTKYLSNRLKELKQNRYQRIMQGDAQGPPPPSREQQEREERAEREGRAPREGSGRDRATFTQ